MTDNQIERAKPYVFHSRSVCAGCGCSGEDFGSVNVEAFEVTGELYCDDCALYRIHEVLTGGRDARPQPQGSDQ